MATSDQQSELESAETAEDLSRIYNVAPDPAEGDPYHVGHFNTIVVKPSYRLTLHFYEKDMDLLFPETVKDVKGRIPRLHVLSFFSLIPGRKKNSSTRFGKPDKYDEEECEKVSWKYFCKHAGSTPITPNTAESYEKLKTMLGENIVDKGKLPKPAEFCKIFVPGGYAITDEFVFPGYFLDGVKNGDATRYLYQVEYYKANPSLGMIPLVAHVEKKEQDSNTWKPVEGACVYFQLVKPDDVTDANKPEAMATHQKTEVEKIIKDKKGTDGDPQQFNVGKDLGGKRDHPLAGKDRLKNIFLTETELEGFHKPHSKMAKEFKESRPTESFPEGRRNYAPASTTTDYDHAVRSVTNEDGEAGMIFMPSMCGGDRYKMRVFVGTPTQEIEEEDLTEEEGRADVVETGTFVIWRYARVSQVLAPPYNEPVKASMWRFTDTGDTLEVDKEVTLDELPIGKNSMIFKEYNKAYLHLKFDCKKQTTFTKAKWQSVHTKARAWMKANHTENINHDVIVPANVDVDRPEFAQLRSAADYNTEVSKPGVPGGTLPNPLNSGWRNGLKSYSIAMLDRMMYDFTEKGYMPGMTIIRGLRPYRDFEYNHILWGIMRKYHGCFMFYNNDEQRFGMPVNLKPMEIVAIHESGHSYCYRHQHTGNEGESSSWTSVQEILPLHEKYFTSSTQSGTGVTNTGPTAANVCLMSYHTASQYFCAKCLLAIRGWNVAKI